MPEFSSQELFIVLRAVVPSFIIALIGYLLARMNRDIHAKVLYGLIFNLFSPCFIFSSLYKRSFDISEFSLISCSVLVLIVFMFPLASRFKLQSGIEKNGYYLPIVFMSTGTISLPMSLFLYGNEGVAKAVLFHIVNLVAIYSLGNYLVCGRPSLSQLLKMPAIYAALLGIFASQVTFVEESGLLFQMVTISEQMVEAIGLGAIPLLIFAFGYSLNSVDISNMKEGITGGLLRIVGGPALAFFLIYVLRTSEIVPLEKGADVLQLLDIRTSEAVIILNSAMPGPIMAYTLSAKYDHSPEKIAAMVATGTIGSIITIPFVIALINLLIFN